MAEKKADVTGVNTHVAVKNGYAEGRIIEAGEFVPAGLPIAHVDEAGSGHWMTEAPKAE